jgi:hypothetical protein
MTTASLFTDVEFDPRSSKFGKMKIPGSRDTYIDLTGGIGSYITLLWRFSGKTKSATTGKLTDVYNAKYGARNMLDIFFDFMTNKAAPAPAALLPYLRGRTFEGDKPTLGYTAKNLTIPISTGNIIEIFQDEDAVTAIISSIFDMIGAGQTNYGKFK